MDTYRTTVRMPVSLSDRLRRAHYLSKRSQNDIITDSLDHWLANPRRPGCVRITMIETALIGDAPDNPEQAST